MERKMDADVAAESAIANTRIMGVVIGGIEALFHKSLKARPCSD